MGVDTSTLTSVSRWGFLLSSAVSQPCVDPQSTSELVYQGARQLSHARSADPVAAVRLWRPQARCSIGARPAAGSAIEEHSKNVHGVCCPSCNIVALRLFYLCKIDHEVTCYFLDITYTGITLQHTERIALLRLSSMCTVCRTFAFRNLNRSKGWIPEL